MEGRLKAMHAFCLASLDDLAGQEVHMDVQQEQAGEGMLNHSGLTPFGVATGY